MHNTIRIIEEEKIIVIVRGVNRENLSALAQAVYRGGVRLIECTYDASGKCPDEEIASNIQMLTKAYAGKMLIGAGTVLTEKQVELTKAAGGKFIISPDTNPAVIRKTKQENLVSIPGSMTPSEAVTAHNAGADFVKIFPVSTLGAQYVKDITAPLSHIRFLAVGGVNPDNMAEFLKAGACGFGIGSDIVNKKQIEQHQFEEIEKTARRYTEICRLAKEG